MEQWSEQQRDDSPHRLRELEVRLEQLAQLAEQGLERGAYYDQWLAEGIALADASGAVLWNARQMRFELVAQLQTDIESQLQRDPFRRQQWQRLNQAARDREPSKQVIHSNGSAAKSRCSWLAPILVDGNTVAVAEFWFDTSAGDSEAVPRLLQAVCEAASVYEAQWDRRNLGDEAIFWRRLAELAARLPLASSLELTEQTLVNEARVLARCDRATLVRVRDGSVRAVAVSDATWFERRSAPIRSVEELARVAASNREAIWHGVDLPPVAEELQGLVQSYIDQSSVRLLGVIPLTAAVGEGPVAAVLVVQAADGGSAVDRKQKAEEIAGVCSGPLAQAYDLHGLPLLGVSRWARDTLAFPFRWRVIRYAVAVVLLAAIAGGLIGIPADLEIEARGQLLPTARFHVFAPADGVVAEVHVAHGEQVAAGEPLLTMRSAALAQEAIRLRGELDSTNERILALNSARALNSAEGGAEQRAEMFRVSAELAQLESVVASYRRQLEIISAEQKQLAIASPAAGQVLTWHVEEELHTRPVNRGQKLLTIAATGGEWELLLDVPAGDAGFVREAWARGGGSLEVTFVVENDPTRELRGEMRELGQAVDRGDDDALIVPATVSLPEFAPGDVPPGATVRGRIACGRRAIGFVWFRQIIRYIQLNWI